MKLILGLLLQVSEPSSYEVFSLYLDLAVVKRYLHFYDTNRFSVTGCSMNNLSSYEFGVFEH